MKWKSNLTDTQFKTLVIKMLNGKRGRINDHKEIGMIREAVGNEKYSN